MNKLTKQLLSLGLSAVTVAGMVTPVLADDEVPTTTEPETNEVANQPTEDGPSNEIVMKSITLQITKDGQTTSTTFDVDVNLYTRSGFPAFAHASRISTRKS